jgi:endoglucanase
MANAAVVVALGRTNRSPGATRLAFLSVGVSLWMALPTGSVQSGEPPALGPGPHPGALDPVSRSRWPSRLLAQGNRLVNSAGEVIRLKGLMIPDPARVAGEGRYTRALFETLRATGANVVRIPVHPQHWSKDPEYLTRYLDPAVRWTGELGMYVILDWHSIGNVLTGYAPQVPQLFCHTEAMTTNFWERVAGRFNDAPHVIFEIFNEPQNISAADWRRCANRLVAAIRAQRARQLIIVGGLEYGRDLDWVLREPVAGENLAYASHIFPSHARSGWDHDFGSVAKRHPVVVTEWGFIDQTQTPRPPDVYLSGDARTYGEPLMSYLDGRGIGWVACWFDAQWQPAMLLPAGQGYTRWGSFAAGELRKAR